MTVIGVTASRTGLTQQQQHIARNLLRGASELHHGDCTGGDADLHAVAREASPGTKIILHPPTDGKHRAWCEGDREEDPLPYRERNTAIVEACDMLVAFPHSMVELRRSGTWMTVRIARASKTSIVIVYPDGSIDSGSHA